MKLEPCKGCGRMILTHKIANLDVKCDPTPLDGMGIADELRHGRQLWTPRFGPGLIPKELAPARPGDAKLVREHRCTAAGALSRPLPASQVQPTPSGPSADRTAPSSGPSTAHSSVRSAERPRSSSNPRCEDCGLIMDDGEYVSVQLGDVYQWAQHLTNCTKEQP